MSKLPTISGVKLIKALTHVGYHITDQKGSHIHLKHPERKPSTVPNHKEVAKRDLKENTKRRGFNCRRVLKISLNFNLN